MPLAKYITEFLALGKQAQSNAVLEGKYNKNQLECLRRHVENDKVAERIDIMINHGELNLEQVTPLPIEKPKSDTVSLLDPVAAQINDEYTNFEALEKQATISMLKIGLLMEHAKEQLPHGQFKKWAEANLTVHYRHALRFRKLAQVFIKAQHIDASETLALVDPANSQQALGEKLRQMAFEFLGDKTQAELFAEHGIQVREQKKLGGAREPSKPLKVSLKQQKEFAEKDLHALMFDMQNLCINEKRKVHLADLPTLRLLEGDLVDALKNVRELINAE
jgi:hypothetical protein